MAKPRVEDKDNPALKQWLTKRLENISDADPDVLADYALVLIKTDEPDDVLRTSCVEGLSDFLHDNTDSFVQDVLKVLRTKEYIPGHSSKQQRLSAQATPFELPKKPNGEHSKKRAFGDRKSPEVGESRQKRQTPSERPQKQLRRGGNARGEHGPRGRGGRQSQNGFTPPQMNMFPNMYGMPPSGGPGFPTFDPNDPMAAMMAMQAMGFASLPGFPQMSGQGSPPASPFGQDGYGGQQNTQRCRSYDEQGYCEKGAHCPFVHDSKGGLSTGNDEYDPNQAPLFGRTGGASERPHPNNTHGRSRASNQRGRGHHASQRGGRSGLSMLGPNYDRTNTSIVVDNIPEDKFNEEEVRSSFAEFGPITNINMQPYKRLAIITYEDYDSAHKAYESPKVIFDNRFVKVFWQRPGADPSIPTPVSGGPSYRQHQHYNQSYHDQTIPEPVEDTEMIDPEEFAKRQEEAQRAHEEKIKKLKEAAVAKEELDARIKAQAEERKKLMEKLAAKTGGNAAAKSPEEALEPLPGSGGANGTSDVASGNVSSSSPNDNSTTKDLSQTAALRAKLASLEAEAANIGISSTKSPMNASAFPNFTNNSHHSQPFQSYRSRGRAGYNPSYRGRGGWRGGYAGAAAGGAVARLDNRPKSVIITAMDEGVDFENDSGKGEESLRSFLFGVGDFSSIASPSISSSSTGNSDAKDPKTARIVAFNERYIAESFITSAKQGIPGIGKVSLTWLPNTAQVPSSSMIPPPTKASVPQPAPSSVVVGEVEHAGFTSKDGAVNGGFNGSDKEAAEVDAVMELSSDHLNSDGLEGMKGVEKSAGGAKDNEREKDLDIADDDDSAWL